MTATAPDAARGADLGAVARGGALNMLGAVTYGASGFVLVVLVTGRLGAEGTGELLLAIAAFNILVRMSELGSATGLVRFISRDIAAGRAGEIPTLLRSALFPVAAAGTLIGAGTFAASSLIGGVFADGSSSQAVAAHVRTLAPFLPLASVYSVVVQGSRGFGSMRLQAVVDRIGKPLLQLVAVQAALVGGAGGPRVSLAWVAPVALASIPAGTWMRRLVQATVARDGTRVAGDRAVASELWRFSGPRFFGQMFTIGVLWFDTLLIGALRSAEEAGLYAASTRYLLIGTFTAEAVMQVLSPHISRLLTRGEVTRAESLFRSVTAWQVCLVWPVFLVVALHPETLLGVFGEEFVQASTALAILAVAMLVTALLGPTDSVVLMAGRSGLSMLNGGVTLAVNVGGNLLLTPRYGIEGAAIAWGASLVASALLPGLQLRSVSGIRMGGKAVVLAATAAVACFGVPALAARALLGQSIGSLVVTATVSALLALPVAWWLRSELALGELVGAFRRDSRRASTP